MSFVAAPPNKTQRPSAGLNQAALFIQQIQRRWKWRRFWGILYRESTCATTRLELFEGSGPPPAEKSKKAENTKRLIKLSDCVHVAEANGDASNPKETSPFFLETMDKCYLLAAESAEAADWILKLCELAFPVRAMALGKEGLNPKTCSLSMEENSLYSTAHKVVARKEFDVTVRATHASERCRLWGRFILRAEEDTLELQDLQTGEVLYSWPYRFLRRFGRDKVTFSFEAGRRCASGEGSFEFETNQGNEIFQVIELAISAQRGGGGEGPKGQSLCPLSGVNSHYAEPHDVLLRPDAQGGAKTLEWSGKANTVPDSDYAVPFDAIAKSLMASFLNSFEEPPEPYPLYDSINEAAVRKQSKVPAHSNPEHIYDEPEGLASHIVYDEPLQVKGEAWKLQATAEDPVGHEYPYSSQQDDYSGKNWLKETEYDNVALRFLKKKDVQ
uniref:Docking protein 2 n=1 Tax=Sphenodon punctatus TaxID=8508 RepID=A0A8D0H489_SPHPU